MIDCYCLFEDSILYFFCLSLNDYDTQLQSRRKEAEQTETALWHWSLNLQAKVMKDLALLITSSSGFLQLHSLSLVCML